MTTYNLQWEEVFDLFFHWWSMLQQLREYPDPPWIGPSLHWNDEVQSGGKITSVRSVLSIFDIESIEQPASCIFSIQISQKMLSSLALFTYVHKKYEKVLHSRQLRMTPYVLWINECSSVYLLKKVSDILGGHISKLHYHIFNISTTKVFIYRRG